MRFPMLRAFRELALGEWYLEKSVPKKIAKALLMAFLAVPMMLTVYALHLVYKKRAITGYPPIPLEREKEVLRELTWRRMKKKYGLEDLDEQELERAKDRLRRLIETGGEEG